MFCIVLTDNSQYDVKIIVLKKNVDEMQANDIIEQKKTQPF